MTTQPNIAALAQEAKRLATEYANASHLYGDFREDDPETGETSASMFEATQVALKACKEAIDALAAAQSTAVPEKKAVPAPELSGPVLENEGEIAFADGWNAAIASMLSAAPRAPAPVEPAWAAAVEEARDAILNDRGPLEGEAMSDTQTNAVLGIIDSIRDVAMKLAKDGSYRHRAAEDLLKICATSATPPASPAPVAMPLSCIGLDPACPCQDGDACHYVATKTTKAIGRSLADRRWSAMELDAIRERDAQWQAQADALQAAAKTDAMRIEYAETTIRDLNKDVEDLQAELAALRSAPTGDYQAGYDAAIAECAKLGWKTGAQPLTDEQIDSLDAFALYVMAPRHRESVRLYGRAIERAHGITTPPAADGEGAA